MFWNSKNNAIRVDVIHKIEKTEDCFAQGVVVKVTNGKGMLKESLYTDENNNACLGLTLGDKLLFQLQGDRYFCPTCDKILKTGYNLEQTSDFMMDKINKSDSSFQEVVEELESLLGLLRDGYYILWDTELYPTDGNGVLFWDYGNEDISHPTSAIYYLGDGDWGSCRPYYMVATEPKNKMNKERVEYYRNNPDCRAVAYYIDGNMTALIDGHHKAMAAALEHRNCNAIVISPCCLHKDRNYSDVYYLHANDESIYLDGLDIKYLDKIYEREECSFDKIKEITDNYDFDYDISELASYYPTVEQQTCIDFFDEPIDKLVEDYLAGTINAYTDKELERLISAVGGLRHKRLFEIIDYTLTNSSDGDVLFTAAEQLEKLPVTDELIAYMINMVVELEDDYPEVAKKIMNLIEG